MLSTLVMTKSPAGLAPVSPTTARCRKLPSSIAAVERASALGMTQQ
jgi:hypothetical protein